ncbi:hypothetical protein [Streptomyces sp. NPDC058202]|uniref:hypothetical protein n=1 Tax=Streptomyces sp. NPDC058202 TaxID=3346380 RepID=UPI0036E97C33
MFDELPLPGAGLRNSLATGDATIRRPMMGKDAPPPQLSESELAKRRRRAAELASTCRSALL